MITPNQEIVWRDPKNELRPHKLNKRRARFAPGTPQWDALCDDVEERGIQEPLKITSKNEVLKGETRRQVCATLGKDKVPCVIVPDDQVKITMLEDLGLQKHFTPGQRAYEMLEIIGDVIEEAKARQMDGLKKGKTSRLQLIGDGSKPVTIDELCKRFGFSDETLRQARLLRSIFAGDKEILRQRNLEDCDPKALKATWEPKILRLEDPVGLGAALAGMAGQKATVDKERPVNAEKQLELFTDGVEALTAVAKGWGKLKAEKKPELIATFRKQVAAWSPAFCRELAEVLQGRITTEAE